MVCELWIRGKIAASSRRRHKVWPVPGPAARIFCEPLPLSRVHSSSINVPCSALRPAACPPAPPVHARESSCTTRASQGRHSRPNARQNGTAGWITGKRKMQPYGTKTKTQVSEMQPQLRASKLEAIMSASNPADVEPPRYAPAPQSPRPKSPLGPQPDPTVPWPPSQIAMAANGSGRFSTAVVRKEVNLTGSTDVDATTTAGGPVTPQSKPLPSPSQRARSAHFSMDGVKHPPDSPAVSCDGTFFGDEEERKEREEYREKRRLERTTEIKKVKSIAKIDAFATKVVESSTSGGAITVLVWGATVAYIIILVIQWQMTPPTKIVGTEWTIGFGPSPMKMTCMATSGCLVSNVLSTANTLGISPYVSPDQTVCMFLPYQASIPADVVFSVDPTEGLSVMWDPTTANATSLIGAGVVIISEIRCPSAVPGGGEPSCVFPLPTPIGPGTALLQYVETFNETAAGEALHRREWFANMISPDGRVLHGSTPCYNLSNPDPRYAGWVQARLRMNSFYNTVNISKDSFWLFLFGAVGGAYALFLQAGALILALIGFTVAMNQKWQERRASSMVHDEATASQRGAAGSVRSSHAGEKGKSSLRTAPSRSNSTVPLVSKETV